MYKFALFTAVLLLLIAASPCRMSALPPADQPAGNASNSSSEIRMASADAPADSQPANAGDSADPAPNVVVIKQKQPGPMGKHPFSVAFTTSILGFGADVAVPVTRRSNVRAGFNLFNYSHTFTNDGIDYVGKLRFRSVQALYDWFPFRGGFHLSPGMMIYNGNQITANATVPTGSTLTLGGVDYTSDPTNPLKGTAKLTVSKAAPLFMIGFGNLVPRTGRHFAASFDIGAAYQGTPKVALNLTGNACDPATGICTSASDPTGTVYSNVQAQQKKINNSISSYRFFPVISMNFGYRF